MPMVEEKFYVTVPTYRGYIQALQMYAPIVSPLQVTKGQVQQMLLSGVPVHLYDPTTKGSRPVTIQEFAGVTTPEVQAPVHVEPAQETKPITGTNVTTPVPEAPVQETIPETPVTETVDPVTEVTEDHVDKSEVTENPEIIDEAETTEDTTSEDVVDESEEDDTDEATEDETEADDDEIIDEDAIDWSKLSRNQAKKLRKKIAAQKAQQAKITETTEE